MIREISTQVQGYATIDGDGVKLVRVLSSSTYKDFDPILMLDSFDTTNYEDYKGGFPMHPHRGIETISYLSSGAMTHSDSLGNEDTIRDGQIQWMCAGSGIIHAEKLPKIDRMLGVQLWLNLPAKHKMTAPSYKAIKNSDIKEIEINGGKLRLLAGNFGSYSGYKGDYLPLDYYCIHLKSGSKFSLNVDEKVFVMLFTLKGEIEICDKKVSEKTAVKLGVGDMVEFIALSDVQVLFISSTRLDEDIAWGGPIVMNTKDELRKAFIELENGSFIKSNLAGF